MRKLKFKSIMLVIIVASIAFVSCNKDEEGSSGSDSMTVEDYDGNVYQSVIIGTQTWMSENLKTTKYNFNIHV